MSRRMNKNVWSMMGVNIVTNYDNYLGLPIDIGRRKESAFNYLVEKMKRRTTGWKEKSLSGAGRDVLIKTVLQAIPTYVLSCFELPKSTCDAMHAVMAKFWWGSSQTTGRIHRMAWDRLCNPKRDGGLGFRNMRDFNIALLAMQGWRILQRPNSLVTRVLQAKHFPSGDFIHEKVKPGASYIWRSIVAGRGLLEKGSRFRIGSGEDVRVWQDRWLAMPYGLKPFSHPPEGNGRAACGRVD